MMFSLLFTKSITDLVEWLKDKKNIVMILKNITLLFIHFYSSPTYFRQRSQWLTSSMHAHQSPEQTAGQWATAGALVTIWILGCGTWSCVGRGWTAGAVPLSWACPWNPGQHVDPAPAGLQSGHEEPVEWQTIPLQEGICITPRHWDTHGWASHLSGGSSLDLFGVLVFPIIRPLCVRGSAGCVSSGFNRRSFSCSRCAFSFWEIWSRYPLDLASVLSLGKGADVGEMALNFKGPILWKISRSVALGLC